MLESNCSSITQQWKFKKPNVSLVPADRFREVHNLYFNWKCRNKHISQKWSWEGSILRMISLKTYISYITLSFYCILWKFKHEKKCRYRYKTLVKEKGINDLNGILTLSWFQVDLKCNTRNISESNKDQVNMQEKFYFLIIKVHLKIIGIWTYKIIWSDYILKSNFILSSYA